MKKYLFLFLFLGCSLFANKELKILNWPEYIDVELLKKFTSQTDISIKYDIYENNEELIKVLESADYYDIVFPSSSYLSFMVEKGLISSIDSKKLDNYEQIDTFFLNNTQLKKYAIPYTWGTTGVVYNKQKISINSFKELWSSKLKDKVFILNDMNDMFAIAFNVLGIDINTQKEEEIKKGYEKLKELLPNIKGVFDDSEKLNIEFINENVYAAIAYNGDIKNIVKNKKFKYTHPKEGALLWIDTIAISANAKNIDELYSFIDFIISKNNSLQNFKTIGYATPNKGILLNSDIYPSKEDRKNLKRVQMGKSQDIYNKYWNMFLDDLSKKGISYE